MDTEHDEGGRREGLAVDVRHATLADLDRLSAVIARAFDDDPVMNWMVIQDRRRARRIFDVMDDVLRKHSMPRGHVYTTEGVHGGALWQPPRERRPGVFEQMRTLPVMARAVGWRRMATVMAGFNAIEKMHPKVPHFYLGVLATDPEYQGRGVGSQLMAPVLERCDREGIPAYLESSKERNVALYQRHGFVVTEAVALANGGPKVWLMWREARSPTA